VGGKKRRGEGKENGLTASSFSCLLRRTVTERKAALRLLKEKGKGRYHWKKGGGEKKKKKTGEELL